jgi:sugar (pentulose or hexulose) kinase
VLEGIAFGVYSALADLEAAGSPVDELRVAGGGGRLTALSQIKADVLGLPVVALRADAAAIGTALLAAGAAGMGNEVPAAVASVLASAGRFEPSAAAEGLGLRREWFETTRAAAAVREDRGSG